MSQGPSTLGTMITSMRSPISPTIRVRSSSTHGDSSALTRVHSAVRPRSMSRPTRMRPSRAASLRSTGIASSRLPSRTSVWVAMSAALATIFSLEKSRKWIIRDGLTGISRSGSGAPMASGLKWSRGLRMGGTILTRQSTARARALGRLQAPQLRHRRRVRGVSALARAAVEVGHPLVAAVEDERVAGADHRPAAWRPHVRPVLARDAEDEHALLVELELGQRAIGDPVARLDHELGHDPV